MKHTFNKFRAKHSQFAHLNDEEAAVFLDGHRGNCPWANTDYDDPVEAFRDKTPEELAVLEAEERRRAEEERRYREEELPRIRAEEAAKRAAYEATLLPRKEAAAKIGISNSALTEWLKHDRLVREYAYKSRLRLWDPAELQQRFDRLAKQKPDAVTYLKSIR